MSSNVGVWIDHRHAVIVLLGSGDEARTVRVESRVEKHPEREGDSPLKGPYEARQVPADDRRQRSLTGKLDIYYDAVIKALGDVAGVLIFGPGEAKGELKKRLERHHLADRIAAVETADKMTDPQILAKVRGYFQPHAKPASG